MSRIMMAQTLLLLLAGCSSGSGASGLSSEGPEAAMPQAASTRPSSPGARQETAGGITWEAPAGWSHQPDRPMRVATYGIPGPSGQTGEVGVFFFAGGQGGTVEMNIDRWRRQFVGNDGGPPREIARRVRQVSGLRVTTLELAGTYRGSRGPMAPGGPPKPGYEMMAAIVQGPRGPVFFKLIGPAQVVKAARSDLNSLLDSVRLGPG